MDTEVMNLLKGCYEEAKQLLSENRELMDKLAAHLIEKETITGKEFMKIFREEKGIPEPEEDEKERKEIEEKADAALSGQKEEDVPEKKEDDGAEAGAEESVETAEEKDPGTVGRFSNTPGSF